MSQKYCTYLILCNRYFFLPIFHRMIKSWIIKRCCGSSSRPKCTEYYLVIKIIINSYLFLTSFMIKLKIQPDDIPCETDLKCSAMKALKKNLGRGTFEFLIWYFPLLDYKYITVQLYLLKDLKKWKHIFFWISHMASLSVQSQSRDRTYDLFPHGKLYSTQSYNKYFSLLFCSMAMQSDKNGWIYSTLLLKERPNKGHRILKYQTENCHVDWTFNQELGLQEIMSLTLFCFAEN